MKHLLKYYKPLLTTLLIGLVVFGIGSSAYAAEQCVVGDVTDVSYMTSALTHLMAWAWSIPAIVAGELMSNDLIYGQIVGLEHYFYQFWTLMRTIANFALVAIIVILIGQVAIGKEEVGKMLREQGWKVLISGVLINMSRFLMGAMIDVSTVMIAGVGQMTNTFITQTVAGNTANDADMKWLDKIATGIPGKITVNKCGCIDGNIGAEDGSRKWSELVTRRNNIAGPLIFLGAGIMKLQTYSMNVGCGSETLGDVGKLTVKSIIQIALMIMFITPLVVLAAYNLFRLIYIWGWIVFSPLIILYNLLGDVVGVKVDTGLQNAISLKNIIFGLLQPVLTVGALSIGVMLVVGLYKTVDYQNTDQLDAMKPAVAEFTNQAASSTISIDEGKLGTMTLIDKVIEDPTGTVGGGFGYLLVAFATCFVMWMLVKMSFSVSADTFSAVGFNPQEMMEKMNNAFMTKTKVPDLGMGTPFEGASLSEATKLLDPEQSQIIKSIEEMTKSSVDEDEKKSIAGIRKSLIGKWTGMQDNGDLSGDDKKRLRPTSTVASFDHKTTDLKSYTTGFMQKMVEIAKEKEGAKTFTIDGSDSESYAAIQEWFDKGGKKLLDPKNIDFGSMEEEKQKELKKQLESIKSFDTEYKNNSSYLGGLIRYLAQGNGLKTKDDKIIYPDLKSEKISGIDFKSL